MPITAALIARGNVVLAEYYPSSTNFAQIARRLIEQIPSTPDSKKSYSYESHNFHYLVEGGITYICMTDQALGYRVPYAFLFDLNNRFKSTYGQKVHTAGPMSMNESFGRVLQERLDFFSNDKSVDKVSKVRGDIDEVKVTMSKNIEKLLDRNEKIEVLLDKTDDLNNQAQSFKQKGTKLKKKMWWKNCKLTCCLVTICVVILVVVVFILLGYFGVFKWLNIFGGNNGGNSTTQTSSQMTTTMATTHETSSFATSTTKDSSASSATIGTSSAGTSASSSAASSSTAKSSASSASTSSSTVSISSTSSVGETSSGS